MKEWSRFNIDMQEKLCTKYNITLTDFQTVRTKRIKTIKRIGHIGGVIALQSYQALKAYNSKPVKKKRVKKKSSVLHGLTGKR
jgi:hypothetical protein